MTGFTRGFGLAAGLLVTSALPALAQTGLCGGVGDAGQWLGGDEASSDIAASGDYLEQMALVLMNNEYVGLFATSQMMEVRIEAEAQGSGDTVIDIRDAAGNIVASDDDSGGNGSSLAQAMLQPGSYCVSMRSYDGSPLTGFVRVSRLEQAQLTDGQTYDDWTDTTFPGSCDVATVQNHFSDGSVDSLLNSGGVMVSGAAGQTPFWTFTLDQPTAVSITADNPNADPYITLFDSFGNWLAENDDFDGLNSRIDMAQPLEAGTYCIGLSALSDTSLPITLALTTYDAEAAMRGMYDRGEASPPLDGSYPVIALGALNSRVRQDLMTSDTYTWFSFDVAEGGLVVIDAVTNGMGDPQIVLFDDFGRQIAYNDDANNTLDSMIAARVLPGTYVLGVAQLYSDTQVMTRMLFERYVPGK